MWDQLAAFVISVLTVGAGAGWFVGAGPRRVRHMHAEAELWAALPDGWGKATLEGWLDDSALRYARDRWMRWPVRWLFVLGALFVVTGVALGVAVYCLLLEILSEDDPAWTTPTMWAGFAIMALAMLASWGVTGLATRSTRKVADRFKPKVDDTTGGTDEAGHAAG